MKNTQKLFGFAVITAIVFSTVILLIGCENGSGEGKNPISTVDKGGSTPTVDGENPPSTVNGGGSIPTVDSKNSTPTVSDFNISGLSQIYNGSPKAVSITSKSSKSTGTITIYYMGTDGTNYSKSTAAPSAVGLYTVTFDIAAAAGFNAATGLSAGTLTIANQTVINVDPITADFDISGLSHIYDGIAKAVSIIPKAGKSQGQITIHYFGTNGTNYSKSTVPPSAAGIYAVTFDVAAAVGFNAASGLSAGTLTIANQVANPVDPTVVDFDISGLSQVCDGNAKAVSITPKSGKSAGTITVYYTGTGGTSYAKSITAPWATGTYIVTFDVAAAAGFNAATGLSAGTLIVINQTPIAADFEISSLSHIYNDSPKSVSVTPKSGKSAGSITVYYTGTGSTTYTKSTTAPSSAGTYAVTFDIADAIGWNAATGLSAGILIINIPTFTSIAEFETWLSAQPDNTVAVPYFVALNINNLGGSYNTAGSLGKALSNNSTKYVSIDLSGSTFTSIEGPAFYLCDNLVRITIPNSVTSIGNTAFLVCRNLTKITLPNSVTSIGNSAFSGSDNLTSITIPDSVTSIGERAFYNCNGLTSVTIGNGVTNINSNTFYNCHSLTNITIPNNVTSIASTAFKLCSKLTTINIAADNTLYVSQNGVLYNKAQTTLIIYPEGKTGSTFTIPSGVTSIGDHAFGECTKLTSVTIPNTVKNIGDYAFYYCDNLTKVIFQGTIPKANIGSHCFSGDLLTKFYATNSTNGTAGTYTKSSSGSTWTKQ